MREYLKELRLVNNLTMQDIADKIGITRQYYQQIEAGERQKKMDITLVKKLADIFDVSMERIASLENGWKNNEQKGV